MADNLLVTTGWLAAHLADTDLRIVDIRGHVLPATEPPPHYFNHYDDYTQAHIPGAVFVDWVHEITDPQSLLHARIAPPERFAGVMQRCGVDENTFVVAYDDANGMFAARLWWALNYYGHSAVAVLDGGWQKWLAEGHPTTAAQPQIASTVFTPRSNPAWIRTGDQIAAGLQASGSGAAQLVDVRTPGEFAGQASRAKRAGHIPGAVNLPRSELLALDGTLLPPDQLRALFAERGIVAGEIVTYCNAGVSASYGLLALKAAGLGDQAAMYDGSWKDWGNDDSKPIET